jgi:hypothetical protein
MTKKIADDHEETRGAMLMMGHQRGNVVQEILLCFSLSLSLSAMLFFNFDIHLAECKTKRYSEEYMEFLFGKNCTLIS